jgi:hypothetical protein
MNKSKKQDLTPMDHWKCLLSGQLLEKKELIFYHQAWNLQK